MAKRRKTTTRTRTRTKKRKKNQKFSLFFLFKQLFGWSITVFLFIFLLLFVLDYIEVYNLDKESKKGNRPSHPEIELPPPAEEKTKDKNIEGDTKSFKFPEYAEIPQLKNGSKEQVIWHEGYTVSYNSDYRIANWVAYELTEEEVKLKNTERSNKFIPDPQVKGATATSDDYSRSGYDRGHLAPAGDMRWSAKAMRESFYLSNICPQAPGLNRGIWKELEEQVRRWAVDHDAVLVITGPVIEKNMKTLGKNKVAIPNNFYKVVGAIINNEPTAIGFIFENRDYKNTTIRSKAISVDSVEIVTGINFFSSLPLSVQTQMESKINLKDWGL